MMQQLLAFRQSARAVPLVDILRLFLGTRLLLILAAYLCLILFPPPGHTSPQTPIDVPALLAAWNHWDMVHYVQIAQAGYRHVADTAFFPLFPLLIRALAAPFGHRAYPLAALLASNLALLAALIMLYRIAIDTLPEQPARRALLYLCIFPTAFFFFAGYNESLFLLLSCSALFALRRQRWVLAGALGLLAALTRSAGALLIFPYLYELLRARRTPFSSLSQPSDRQYSAHDEPRSPGTGNACARLLGLLLIPLGTLLYCSYCWRHFGDPLAFARVQKFWGRSLTPPWLGILGSFSQLFHRLPFGSFFEVHVLLDLLATLGFLALGILSWRYVRASYALWMSLLLLYTLCSSAPANPDHLVSNQRFVLEMFPGFFVLGVLGARHPRLHLALMISFPTLQALLAALFLLDRWMV
jgi:hypothetical protein